MLDDDSHHLSRRFFHSTDISSFEELEVAIFTSSCAQMRTLELEYQELSQERHFE